MIQFCLNLKEQLQSVPGIKSVAMARVGVFEGQGWVNGIVVEGYQAKEGEDVAAVFNSVSRDYCKTLGVPVKLGREFNEIDELPGAKQVVLVNEAFVKWFLPDRNPLGYHLGIRWSPDAKPDREIIGVVQDSKSKSLRQKIAPLVITPHSQIGISYMTVFVRTSLSSAQVFNVIRERVHAIDTGIPIFGMNTIEDQLDRSLTNERLVGFLSGLFGILATSLSMIGLYGVTAYSVARREKEIGIRLAFGAQKMDVLWLVLREGMILTGIGVGVGLLAALWLTRILRSLLFGIGPHDPVTMISASGLMIVVAALAAWIPARRATRIDPMEALRYE
jgi:predicted permease